MTDVTLAQQIKNRFQLGPASHMTHIKNLQQILANGGLSSYKRMRERQYQSLANDDVQAGRALIIVQVSQMQLHDYVPLYFGFKTPMVACNQSQNEHIVFLRMSLNILAQPGVVFSDGNARSNTTKFYPFKEFDDLGVLDITSIQTVRYANDSEIKRKKQAEILVPNFLSFEQVFDIICFSELAAKEVMKTLGASGIRRPVIVNPGWYFRPLTKGPEAL